MVRFLADDRASSKIEREFFKRCPDISTRSPLRVGAFFRRPSWFRILFFTIPNFRSLTVSRTARVYKIFRRRDEIWKSPRDSWLLTRKKVFRPRESLYTKLLWKNSISFPFGRLVKKNTFFFLSSGTLRKLPNLFKASKKVIYADQGVCQKSPKIVFRRKKNLKLKRLTKNQIGAKKTRRRLCLEPSEKFQLDIRGRWIARENVMRAWWKNFIKLIERDRNLTERGKDLPKRLFWNQGRL